MKLAIAIVSLLTKSVAFAALATRWDPPMEGRIVGGHEAKPYSRPYMVSLQTRFLWVRSHFCGGSLLNNFWVLTAGHCVKESWLIRWLPMDVVAGTHDVDNFGPRAQVNTVDRRIPHPDYKGGIGPNDLALLKVKTPFTYTSVIQPVKLPVGYKMTPESLTLSGWGVLRTTVFFPALPSKLQEVDVTYVSYKDCYEAVNNVKDDNEDNPLDEESNMCTGPITGGIAACNGDSGGPLVQYTTQDVGEISNDDVEQITTENEESTMSTTENIEENTIPTNDDLSNKEGVENELDLVYPNKENGKDYEEPNKIPVILGVVSWGASPCGQKGAPTVYTKVAPFVNFINQYINNIAY